MILPLFLSLLASQDSTDWNALTPRLREARRSAERMSGYLRADPEASVRTIVAALDSMREAGLDPIRLVPLPDESLGEAGEGTGFTLELPFSRTALQEEYVDSDEIAMDIPLQGRFRINGRDVDEDWLETFFRQRRVIERYWVVPGGSTVRYPVLIRADTGTAWRHVARLIQIATVHGGVYKISIATSADGREGRIDLPSRRNSGIVIGCTSPSLVQAPQVVVTLGGGAPA